MEHDVVTCDNCGYVCAARIKDDGRVILPMDGQTCPECGEKPFTEVEMADMEID